MKKKFYTIATILMIPIFIFAIVNVALIAQKGNLLHLKPGLSCSMTHNTDFDTWWSLNENKFQGMYNISKSQFVKFPYKNGLRIGAPFVYSTNLEKVNVGDMVLFNYDNTLVVHRVMKKYDTRLVTMGDNNDRPSEGEMFITKDKFIGKVIILKFDWLVNMFKYPTKCTLPFFTETCVNDCLKALPHDENGCLKLNETQKISCYEGLKQCNDVDTNYRDYCYLGLGNCDLISNVSIKDECFYEQDKCEDIGDTYSEEFECTYRDQCFYDRVIEKNDFCDDAVLTWQERHDCGTEAEAYSVYCDEIQDGFKQTICLMQYGFLNETDCMRINDEESRKNCLEKSK